MRFGDGVTPAVRRELRRAYGLGDSTGGGGSGGGGGRGPGWWWERALAGVRRLLSSIGVGGRWRA